MTARPRYAIDPWPDAQIASARRDWPDYADYIGPCERSPCNSLKLHAISASDYADYADYRVWSRTRARSRTEYPCSPRSPCSPVAPSLMIPSTYRGEIGLHISYVCVVHVVLFLVYVPMVARVSTRSASWPRGAGIGQLGRIAARTACRPRRRSLRLCVSFRSAVSNSGHCGICTYSHPGHGGLAPIGRRFGHSVTPWKCNDINALRCPEQRSEQDGATATTAHGIYSDRAGSAASPPGRRLRPGTLDMRLYSQRRQKSWRILCHGRHGGWGRATCTRRATIGARDAGAGSWALGRGTAEYRPIGRRGAANPLIPSRSAALCNAIQISAVRIAGFCDSGPKNGKITSFRPEKPLFRSQEGR